MLSARAGFAQERNQRAPDQMSARVELLDALEAYVESLADRGLPVPYPLRDELRLMRSTCPARSHVRQPPHA